MSSDICKDRIFDLFSKSGKSDQKLEQEIGLPRSVIYDWRNERAKSYKKYCFQIASYFMVSTDYLLGRTDDPSPTGQKEKPSSISGDRLSALDDALVKSLGQLTQDEIEKVLVFVQGLVAARKA